MTATETPRQPPGDSDRRDGSLSLSLDRDSDYYSVLTRSRRPDSEAMEFERDTGSLRPGPRTEPGLRVRLVGAWMLVGPRTVGFTVT